MSKRHAEIKIWWFVSRTTAKPVPVFSERPGGPQKNIFGRYFKTHEQAVKWLRAAFEREILSLQRRLEHAKEDLTKLDALDEAAEVQRAEELKNAP